MSDTPEEPTPLEREAEGAGDPGATGGAESSPDLLAETVSEVVLEDDGGAALAAAGIGGAVVRAAAEAAHESSWIGEVQGQFRAGTGEAAFDRQFDPEAGITRVADKRWTLRRFAPAPALRQVLLSMVCFLAASTALILAINLGDPVYVYSAWVVTPVGGFFAIRLFRRWKGRRSLTVRIEETLDGPVGAG